MTLQIRPPTAAELREIAQAIGWDPEPDELDAYTAAIAKIARSLDELDGYADREGGPRRITEARKGWLPTDEEDPLGAWLWRCEITEAPSGSLAGKRVAVKDNVAVAGLPQSHGTSFIQGFVPDFDATVITRVLDAGGTIAGKAACAPLSMSSLGDTGGRAGPVANPYKPGHTPGGSSSGSGALVAARAVDMAIGGDQGGSIRIPSSLCGVYGLKPTWGMVPYTGAYGTNPQIDALGPMAATVDNLELLLRALAGPDGWDPRQHAGLVLQPSPIGRVADLRVGVLREGFGWPDSQPDVDAAVAEAAAALGRLGARVSDVSVAAHRAWASLMAGFAPETGQLLFDDFGAGGPFTGFVDPGMMAAADAWRARPGDLPLQARLVLLTARALRDQGRGVALAHSQNHALAAQAAYDEALREVDVLVCPTTPTKALPIPAPGADPAEEIAMVARFTLNTRQFNRLGHPALSVPCGLSDGLPIGMQLVGRRGEDLLLVEVARWFEAEVAPAPAPPAIPASG
jgi:amidase